LKIGQTIQWPNEKGQTISTKHTHKDKDRATRTQQQNGMNLVIIPLVT